MSCVVGEMMESLDSFSLSVTSPTSQLIIQPFRRFTYVTAHSPTLPLLHLRHSSFSNPSFASPTSQALHYVTWRAAHVLYSRFFVNCYLGTVILSELEHYEQFHKNNSAHLYLF